jgi:beta-carotene ketolase (CrtW type)
MGPMVTAPSPLVRPPPALPALARYRGLLVAAGLIGAWLLCLGWGLTAAELPWAAVAALVLLETLLSTGLFITAHDAMHGLVLPGAPRVNAAIGQLALGIYAGFAFQPLRAAHLRHHQAPATAEDPDFHDGQRAGFWPWYVHFMRNYLSGGQVLRVAVMFNLGVHLLGFAPARLLAFWAAPALLSTLQLFYFGTYLTHRLPPGGYADVHHATSSDLPVWLSLLTCFHFGYHHEHHVHAGVPWWGLPSVRGKLAGVAP